VKKIAVLCPIHKRPDLVIEQLENYKYFSDNGCFHILHPSREGRKNFAEKFEEEITSFGIICENSKPTSWKTIMAAFIECSRYLSNDSFDYVYIHTDGDLLFKGNLKSHIYDKKIGFSGSFPEPKWNWPHYKTMFDDNRFKQLRASLQINDEDILVGRQEGSFFPIKIWRSIVEQISKFYDDSFFEEQENLWPLEEALIPTLANFFNEEKNRSRNIIYTKELKNYTALARENEINSVTIQDIQNILGNKNIECAGMKWFSPKTDNEARKFIKYGMSMYILDCTLRDGGYYNSWNFPIDTINKYLEAMAASGVDIVELGLRSLINKGFNGASAYTTDSFIGTLNIPSDLKVAVMINATEIVGATPQADVLEALFPNTAENSPVDVVRIACHVHEFVAALPACNWFKERGYMVGFNLMQVADRSQEEVEALSLEASKYPIDALYFADSMGSMNPAKTSQIIGWLRKHWHGAMGIHTHDNMGLALSNTLQAVKDGVTWLDATVTGMGRGPGNARTEELVIEVADIRKKDINMVPLMSVIRSYFQPLKNKCGWGSNPYYYLSGKYGIHPTYIQEMLGDSRYSEEDILAAINHLKVEGGKKFSLNTLDSTRHFYSGTPRGSWNPKELFENKKVLLLGTGAGVSEHRIALENFIKAKNPLVVALNTQSGVSQTLIDVRIACHPIRLLADCEAHSRLPQPLITPSSMLPPDVLNSLKNKKLLDYGISINQKSFEFGNNFSSLPTSLVICYALAVITAGGAESILMAGFDGYEADDPRNSEMNYLLNLYASNSNAIELIAITPTRYELKSKSVYGPTL
jgi:4-hydroxy 2-oxovalerate aldolase